MKKIYTIFTVLGIFALSALPVTVKAQVYYPEPRYILENSGYQQTVLDPYDLPYGVTCGPLTSTATGLVSYCWYQQSYYYNPPVVVNPTVYYHPPVTEYYYEPSYSYNYSYSWPHRWFW
jgi:hypothetical protein